jgi:cytochrome c556
MISITKAFVLGLSGLAFATLAHAQSADHSGAIKARKAHMTLYGTNLGVLGAMAQGKMPYDADAATAAAESLVALAGIDERFYWPEGSASGMAEGTRAMEAIWTDPEGFSAAQEALLVAATAMAATAGTGVEGIQAGMQAMGGACGACHQNYRVRQ